MWKDEGATLSGNLPASSSVVPPKGSDDEVDLFWRSSSCALSWLRGDYAYLQAMRLAKDGPAHTLRLAGHNPADSFVVEHVFAPAFRVLERMTHGRIRIEPVWDGRSHRLVDGWQALRDRRVDMTACYSSLDAVGLGFELVQGLHLPGLFPSPAVGTLASELLFDRYLRHEYERQGVRMGRLKATESDVIFSVRPVRCLEDMGGLRIAAGSGWHGKTLEVLGAVVVPTPSDDISRAIGAGEIDAACMTDGSCDVFRVSERVRFRLEAGLGRLNLEYCLSPEAFEELPSDLQAAFGNWLRGLSQAESQVFYGLGGAYARRSFRQCGMEFTTLNPNEQRRWQDKVKTIQDSFVLEMETKNIPARHFIRDARRISNAYASASNDHLMQRAIFSPVTGISESTQPIGHAARLSPSASLGSSR